MGKIFNFGICFSMDEPPFTGINQRSATVTQSVSPVPWTPLDHRQAAGALQNRGLYLVLLLIINTDSEKSPFLSASFLKEGNNGIAVFSKVYRVKNALG